MFQSLFLWIFRSYLTKKYDYVHFWLRFQSLFLWIFRSYLGVELLAHWIRWSFNPCSYGSFVLTYNVLEGFIFQPNVSILVLMDLSFLQGFSMPKGCLYGKFQSLFLWIFRSYKESKNRIFPNSKYCFNPCSYGSFVLTYNCSMLSIRLLKVSILVLMDLSFLLKAQKTIYSNIDYVSILVLMDLPFLPSSRGVIYVNKMDSFNPCSYGSSVLTNLCYSHILYYFLVSILVLMDLPFLPETMTEVIQATLAFQSLFLWIFRSYLTDGTQVQLKADLFQSLFLWIFRSYYEWISLSSKISKTFQSLFLWIFRSYDEFQAKLNEFMYLFQSLFLWIFRSYFEVYANSVDMALEFQSLFLWIFRSYRLCHHWKEVSKIWVSILVLMDLSFLQVTLREYLRGF